MQAKNGFNFDRTQVLTKPVPVKKLVNKFPPLATVSGVRFFLNTSQQYSAGVLLIP